MKMKKKDLMLLRAEIIDINNKEQGITETEDSEMLENYWIGLTEVLRAIKNCTIKKEMCEVKEFQEIQLAEKNSVYDIYKNWDFNENSLDQQSEAVKKTLFILLVKYKK